MPYAIVILEDYPRFFHDMSRFLRRYHPTADIINAATIEDAKRILGERADVACLIADMWMEKYQEDGDQQGRALLAWLRQDPTLARLPVLAISAHQEKINGLLAIGLRNLQVYLRTSAGAKMYDVLLPFVNAACR